MRNHRWVARKASRSQLEGCIQLHINFPSRGCVLDSFLSISAVAPHLEQPVKQDAPASLTCKTTVTAEYSAVAASRVRCQPEGKHKGQNPCTHQIRPTVAYIYDLAASFEMLVTLSPSRGTPAVLTSRLLPLALHSRETI